MKFFILSLIVMNLAFAAEQNPKVGSPPNAASRGFSENSGVSTSPTGPTKQEQQEVRKQAEGMGGAPNIGVGMGTGTGAGSTVGNKVKTDKK
jgi:hypothetical protein